MRCPDCNKFVSLETEITDTDASIDSIEEDTVEITVTVHVSRNCADCGQELKCFDFEDQYTVTLPGPIAEAQADDLSVEVNVEEKETGGGRYAKNLIGYSGNVNLLLPRESSPLGSRLLASLSVGNTEAASNYEECV
jgi:hypothetical protein